MRKSVMGAMAALVVVSLAIAVGADRPAARADVDNSMAIYCGFLADVIDGDPNDVTFSGDLTAACDGLSAVDVELIALAVGDEDGRLELGDLDALDLDANQITDAAVATGFLDQIYIIAFVDDDGTVTFDAPSGAVVVISDDGNPDDISPADDANAETCDGDDDMDCGDTMLDDGDGVVVAMLGSTTGAQGDEIEVGVTQEGMGTTETLLVVGTPANLAVLSVEPFVLQGADSDCIDGTTQVFDDDARADPRSTIIVAFVTDSQGTSITRAAVQFISMDANIAEVGDTTGLSIDSPTDTGVALAVLCGVSGGSTTIEVDIGVKTVSLQVEVVEVLESGPPSAIELKATPNRILCDGIDDSSIRMRMYDDNDQPVADGTEVVFSIEGNGEGSLVTSGSFTLGGELLAEAAFELHAFWFDGAAFEIRATAGDLSGTITVHCERPDQSCNDPNDPVHPASPPCPPLPCQWPGSPPACEDLDTDGDGLLDFFEYEMGTDPFEPDTDGDGFFDLPPVLHASPNADTLRDNCPLDANPGQENSDGNVIVLTPAKAFDDATRAMSDAIGDACDADDDNDGLPDVPSPPCASAVLGVLSPTLADTDGDLVIDGRECAVGTDPTDVASFPLVTACQSALDEDGDGVPDLREFCFYGTSDEETDSDADGCDDAKEAASINGDQGVNSIDLSQVAQAFGDYDFPAPAVEADFDINKDGRINSSDLLLVAQQFGSC